MIISLTQLFKRFLFHIVNQGVGVDFRMILDVHIHENICGGGGIIHDAPFFFSMSKRAEEFVISHALLTL